MYQNGDILVFRNKNYENLLKSVRNLSLDNSTGLILINYFFQDKFYPGVNVLEIINHKIKIKSLNYYKNTEFYHYKNLNNYQLDFNLLNTEKKKKN